MNSPPFVPGASSSVPPVVVSVLADAVPDLLPRLTETLARLDLLPDHVYARLRPDEATPAGGLSGTPSAGHRQAELQASGQIASGQVMEVDFHLRPGHTSRRDRLVKLFATVVGVRGVVCSA